MTKKAFSLFILILTLLLLTSCAYNNYSIAGAEYDESPYGNLESIPNKLHFNIYADKIYNNQPIGSSGKVIALEYIGGIYFTEEGMLTVTVLDAAFDHYESAVAINEMVERGIIIRSVEFTYQQLMATIDALNEIFENVHDAGSRSWGLGTIENRVIVWLYPYTSEQKAIFKNLLFEHLINCSMVTFRPAVTQEMSEERAAFITSAAQSLNNQIVLTGEIELSPTDIVFSLENLTDFYFYYGSFWDMAYYLNGQWLPLPHLPGAGGGSWTLELRVLQGGATRQYRKSWDWRFGDLPAGRYMFIRPGWFGDWSPNQDYIYVLVEFFIEES